MTTKQKSQRDPKDQGNPDAAVVDRYTDQPSTMPPEVRARIEALWEGEPVQIYAMADLDESMCLARTWIALGPTRLVVATEPADDAEATTISIERTRICAVKTRPGLSCTALTVLAQPGEPALAILRYTQRQRRAMEALQFVLDQQLKGHTIEPEKADDIYASSVAGPIREAQASVAVRRLSVLQRLLTYLKPYRWRVAAGLTGAAFMTLVSLLPPYVTGRLIDDVVRPFQEGGLSRQDATHIAWLMIAALAAVHLFRQACVWVRLRAMSVLGELIARDLRDELYEHLQRLSLSYFSRKKTGSIISRVTSDTDRLWEFVAFGMVEASLAIVMLIGLGGILIALDWKLGLLMTLPVPAMLWAIFRHGRSMNRLFLRGWRKWSDVTSVISDTIPGMRVVKAFNRERYEQQRFAEKNAGAMDCFNDLHSVWTKFWPLLMLGIHAVTLAVWVAAIPRVLTLEGESPGHLSAGKFIAILMYMAMFFFPIHVLGNTARMLNRATSSAHRVFEVLDTKPRIRTAEQSVRLEPLRGEVAFDNVSFSYDDIRQVLRNISFDVQPGEMIGLVGPSGAGKTTITNLIARFYDVSSGRILIDGVPLRDLDIGHYRRQIGMVLQEPHLFHGTVARNIAYSMPEASMDQVIEASRAANAHDFICRLPHGYDTIVGERGHTLSGGERQRVSIARAILNNPMILILDEATSSVDTETERKIQAALDNLISGRTVFAIAHRLSTLTRASRLLVVDDGEICEQGTHADLLARSDGVYRKLYDLQRELHRSHAV